MTAEAIAHKWHWNNHETYLKNQRGRQLLKQTIYVAYVNQISIGHIETIIAKNLQDDDNEWNKLYVGKTWALCCYLYVIPEERGKGYGTRIVKQACNQAINNGVDLVSLIVAKDNYKARKFYNNVGFNRHLLQMREQGTLDMWEQEEIIDNLWIRIDLIFYFWRCLMKLKQRFLNLVRNLLLVNIKYIINIPRNNSYKKKRIFLLNKSTKIPKISPFYHT
ncbi:GNAT family N-acetyltransferase [Okeania sp.]|uniref:GNAT family N-acetyltransferase n=1 Tax=Okeania sp. TaxID=3100323 RepID=UPI0035C90175